MASTYSQNLKIELIGTGDQVNSWGLTTNDNLGVALEEAIVGYGAVQFTNDANLTLTLSNSNASQTARKFYLRVTSTVSLSAQRDLIVPTIEKTYTVENATTGGQAIRVITAAGTGIVVPSGKKMLLYVDGANVVEQINYATNLDIGTLNISSPLPLVSGGTGAATASVARSNLGLGSIATQAANNVAITGGSISGVTAALTGTPTAPTAAPGTNTTQIATTAFVQNVAGGLGTMSSQNANSVNITGGSITGITDLAIADGGTGASTAAGAASNLAAAFGNLLYPVGSIYINATNNTNPATLLGFGTWVAFGAGRVMVGFNASDPLFDAAEETGGSKDAVVVSHTHTATSSVSDPGHTHSAAAREGDAGSGAFVSGSESTSVTLTTESASTGISVSTSISTTGSSGTNANLQPYITVFMWKRTA